MLDFDQWNLRMNNAQELLNGVNDDPDLFKTVITDDESWVYGYDIEPKTHCTVNQQFLSVVNKEYYIKVICRLREAIYKVLYVGWFGVHNNH